MNKSAEEAEREVEASRSELDRTVEALKDKMTPGELLDEARRTMGDAGSQIFSKFVEQAKQNPMPLAVMGLGLAWLMVSNNRPRDNEIASQGVGGSASLGNGMDLGQAGGVKQKAKGLADGLSDNMSSAAQAASDKAGAIGDRVSDSAAGALQSAKDAAGQAKAMAGSAAGKAVMYGQKAQQTMADVIDREPLLIGGAGLLAGLAIGASLPATEVEKRYAAPITDKVVDKTKAIAQDRLEDVSEATQAAYHAVKDELAKGASEGQSLVDRADHVARAATQSLRDSASGPH